MTAESLLERVPRPILALTRRVLPLGARIRLGDWLNFGTALVGPAPVRRRAMRSWLYDRAESFTPLVAVDVDERRLLLPTGDEVIGRQTFVDGRPQELPLVARALTYAPAGDVLEVGANIGTTTVFLAGHSRRVVAVEPEPRNFALLNANVAVNGLADRVRCLQLALTDTEGHANLELSPTNAGDHRIRIGTHPDMMGEGRRATITVRTRTVDALVADAVVSPTLLWLDVQGHEGHVLAGAERLLSRGIPVVLELWPYGLVRADGLELLLEVVERHFRGVVELPDGVEEWPARGLRALVERVGDRPQDMSDVLLIP